jgi:aquaporin Z
MKKTTAEFIGTFALVFLGCGAAVIGGMGAGPTAIDVLGIAFAFGLAIVQWHMGSVRYQVATSIRPSVSVY